MTFSTDSKENGAEAASVADSLSVAGQRRRSGGKLILGAARGSGADDSDEVGVVEHLAFFEGGGEPVELVAVV
jgi:hypothetical protein